MNWREDKTLFVLCGGLFFFTAMVFIVVYTKDDVELYALFAGILGQFSGALFMFLKLDKAPPAGSTTDVISRQVTKIPPDPPEVPPIQRGGFGDTGQTTGANQPPVSEPPTGGS